MTKSIHKNKKVKLISKSKAQKVFKALINQGKQVRYWKYCTGKYNPKTTRVGNEIETSTNTYVVARESRSDQDGTYAQLMCITDR